jgi:hypothetical protein
MLSTTLALEVVAEMKVLLPLPHLPNLLSEFVLPDGSTATHVQSS